MASALAGSMSSLTAMQILPQSARSEAAPCNPRHTSVGAVPRAYCRKITLRKFVNGSCIATRLMPRMPSWSRRCERNIGSKATFFITLDSLGVTWLMIGKSRRGGLDTQIPARRHNEAARTADLAALPHRIGQRQVAAAPDVLRHPGEAGKIARA